MTHDTKKIYSEPEAEIIRFEGADVITASSTEEGDAGHATRMPVVY